MRELNMQINIKTKTGKELRLQALVDSECTHTGIDKQLVKEERIKTEPLDRLFSKERKNENRKKNSRKYLTS